MRAIMMYIAIKSVDTKIFNGYVLGAVIALFILGYLLYALLKPEKF